MSLPSFFASQTVLPYFTKKPAFPVDIILRGVINDADAQRRPDLRHENEIMKTTFSKQLFQNNFFKTTLLGAGLMLAGVNVNRASVIFSQDFSSSSTLSDYISATPSEGQWTDISKSGTATVGISGNALQIARFGANSASFTRITDFSPTPTAIIYTFSLNVSGNSVATTTAAAFGVGSGYANGTSFANANTYAKFGINFTTTDGSFTLRDISGSANGSGTFSGTQNIMWVLNNTGGDITYLGPDSVTYTVTNDKWDLWAGTTRTLSNRGDTTSTLAITDLKFLYDTGSGNGTITMDNFSIVPVPEPATWGAISCIGLLGLCGLRTWRERKAKAEMLKS